MLIGYARTSTLDQVAGFEAQIDALEAVGVDKVYQEQVSALGERPELDAALDFAREGDTLVVTKLDRLARNVRHLGEIVESLTERGIALRILDLGLDTSNATGQLMLNIMASVSQFEVQMMKERQIEGIAKARNLGKYKGRKPTDADKVEKIKELHSLGVAKAKIARDVGVSTRTVFRVLDNVTETA